MPIQCFHLVGPVPSSHSNPSFLSYPTFNLLANSAVPTFCRLWPLLTTSTAPFQNRLPLPEPLHHLPNGLPASLLFSLQLLATERPEWFLNAFNFIRKKKKKKILLGTNFYMAQSLRHCKKISPENSHIFSFHPSRILKANASICTNVSLTLLRNKR